MRKSINIFLCLMLVLGFSFNLSAQDEEELDQVKLAQQLIGTWEYPLNGDSVQQITIAPSGGGGQFGKIEYKSGGKVYAEGVSVVGFSPDRKTIELTAVWPDGEMTHDIGRFVTEKKMVVERFQHGFPTHAVAIFEYEFTSPNSFSFVWYGRGQNITWEPLWENKGTYTKID
jgi:hypothetical protein